MARLLIRNKDSCLHNLCDLSGRFVDTEETLELLLEVNFPYFSKEEKRVTHNTISRMQMAKDWMVAGQITQVTHHKLKYTIPLSLIRHRVLFV